MSKLLLKVSYTLIFILFFGTLLFLTPYLLSSPVALVATVAAFVLFSILPVPLNSYTGTLDSYNRLPEKKRAEWDNRLNSFVFNISTAIPSYSCYIGLLTSIWPLWAVVISEPTRWLDWFLGWSVGYIVYDFIQTLRVYGNSSLYLAASCR
eukprot:TRINITY_DN3566_c0_g1_i2.p1 TRINITY_DN3566_c0_g1~~TRINITY_DN3566_c0_g1_i2.p1  ORF type:complete len:151 (+),score=7.09 TRINITY_DN3566_c0_g1_i2:111-563(+)